MLAYLAQEPGQRKFHHHLLTARAAHAFSDNFILPLAHDEAPNGRGTLVAKMPGDVWQKFANLRLLFGCMFAQTGKKLVFMGAEFGQWNEWNRASSLDWHLLTYGPFHRGLQNWVADLNALYRRESALHEGDADPRTFEWVEPSNAELSVISWLRKNEATGETILIVCNFTPVPRRNHRVGVSNGGLWAEILNSDARQYGGSGQGNLGGVEASPFGWDSKSHSLTITLPPLAVVFFKNTN